MESHLLVPAGGYLLGLRSRVVPVRPRPHHDPSVESQEGQGDDLLISPSLHLHLSVSHHVRLHLRLQHRSDQ